MSVKTLILFVSCCFVAATLAGVQPATAAPPAPYNGVFDDAPEHSLWSDGAGPYGADVVWYPKIPGRYWFSIYNSKPQYRSLRLDLSVPAVPPESAPERGPNWGATPFDADPSDRWVEALRYTWFDIPGDFEQGPHEMRGIHFRFEDASGDEWGFSASDDYWQVAVVAEMEDIEGKEVWHVTAPSATVFRLSKRIPKYKKTPGYYETVGYYHVPFRLTVTEK